MQLVGMNTFRWFQGIRVKEEGTRFTLQRLTTGDTAAKTLLSIGLTSISYPRWCLGHMPSITLGILLRQPLAAAPSLSAFAQAIGSFKPIVDY